MSTRVLFALCFAMLAVASVSGCAEGSALVVGEARPAIEDWSSVVLLTEMPEGAEEIAIVKASSDSGMTQQQSLDYAVEELKRQAAKVGANAVILGSRSTAIQHVGVPVYSPQGTTTMVVPSEMEIVQGIAVYIGD